MSQKRPRLGRHARRTGVVTALLSLALVTPAAASSTVSVDGGVLLVTGAPGDTSDISVGSITPPGNENPSKYTVIDHSAGATAGPGCAPAAQGSVECPAAGVQRVEMRLGDGNDTASSFIPEIPVSAYGEAGNDHIWVPSKAGGLADGGDGDDILDGGDDLRGGPGDDRITGTRLLDGGDGNDVLRKTGGTASGRIAAGPGDDSLQSDDGWADELQCGAGTDVVVSADDSDRNDGTCESGKGVGGGGGGAPAKARVTVFELPRGRSRPGRDGRLAVWMRCNVANCRVDVRIFAAGEAGTKSLVRFRHPPLRRVIVGKKTQLVHIRLSREQRRGLKHQKAYSLISAVVITRRPGADARMLTDGFYCSRADPCRS